MTETTAERNDYVLPHETVYAAVKPEFDRVDSLRFELLLKRAGLVIVRKNIIGVCVNGGAANEQ